MRYEILEIPISKLQIDEKGRVFFDEDHHYCLEPEDFSIVNEDRHFKDMVVIQIKFIEEEIAPYKAWCNSHYGVGVCPGLWADIESTLELFWWLRYGNGLSEWEDFQQS